MQLRSNRDFFVFSKLGAIALDNTLFDSSWHFEPALVSTFGCRGHFASHLGDGVFTLRSFKLNLKVARLLSIAHYPRGIRFVGSDRDAIQ